MENQKVKKTKYSVLQNTFYMIKLSLKHHKFIMFCAITIAIINTLKTTLEIFLTPIILKKVEMNVGVDEFLKTLIIFVGLLVIVTAIHEYLDLNRFFPGVDFRNEILQLLNEKYCKTSFENLYNTKFNEGYDGAADTCSDNSSATEAIFETITDIINNILAIIIFLLIIKNLSPILVSVIIFTTILGYFVNKKVSLWGYLHKDEENKYIKEMNYIKKVVSSRDYAKEVKIFGLKTWVDELWSKAFNLYKDFIAKKEKRYLLINISDLILAFARNAIAYFYLISYTINNGLLTSEFLLYFSAISGFSNLILSLINSITKLNEESKEIDKLREFIEWEEKFEFVNGENLKITPTMECKIDLENVSYKYFGANNYTIENLNLSLNIHEKVSIVGLNGAGKTTLVKLICGLLDPTEGRVLLNGVDIKKYNRQEYYKLFSAVFQDSSILEASIEENIAQSVTQIDKEKLNEAIDLANFREKVNSLDKKERTIIGRLIYEDGIELSGGQTQKLLLSRAIYKDSPIIILDEPTAALDPISESEIYQKYSEISNNKLSLFISHRLASTRFCDRVLYFENGKIIEEGNHYDLLSKKGKYYDLYQVQSKYYEEE